MGRGGIVSTRVHWRHLFGARGKHWDYEMTLISMGVRSPHIEALGPPFFSFSFSSCSMLYVYVFDSEDFCLKVADETKWEGWVMRIESFYLADLVVRV